MIVGISQIDITPKPGVELQGFAIREQPSLSIADPLFHRTLSPWVEIPISILFLEDQVLVGVGWEEVSASFTKTLFYRFSVSIFNVLITQKENRKCQLS